MLEILKIFGNLTFFDTSVTSTTDTQKTIMKSTETLEELQEELTRINNLLANVVRHVAVRLPISRSYSGLKTVDNWDKNEQQRMWAALNSLLRIYKNYFMRSEDIRRMICKKRGEKYIRPDNLGLQTPS